MHDHERIIPSCVTSCAISGEERFVRSTSKALVIWSARFFDRLKLTRLHFSGDRHANVTKAVDRRAFRSSPLSCCVQQRRQYESDDGRQRGKRQRRKRQRRKRQRG